MLQLWELLVMKLSFLLVASRSVGMYSRQTFLPSFSEASTIATRVFPKGDVIEFL
jgi:hypothetical protein